MTIVNNIIITIIIWNFSLLFKICSETENLASSWTFLTCLIMKCKYDVPPKKPGRNFVEEFFGSLERNIYMLTERPCFLAFDISLGMFLQ